MTDLIIDTEGTEFADCGPARLAYQSFGDPDRPTVFLVMGLNGQMIAWPDELCRRLAARDLRVVRFDNRDAGLSTHFSDLPATPVATYFGRPPAYRITDMARDLLGLVDVLAPDGAHLVGISMGGMIAQAAAVLGSDRVRSLTSISSTTGNPAVGRSAPDLVMRVLLTRPVHTREERIEQAVGILRRTSSPGYPFNEEGARLMSGIAYDRCYDPAGGSRQLCAVISAADRTARLGRLTIPVTVLHGNADPLVSMTGGVATARAVPNARLVTFPGVGHDLPAPLWDRYADEIATTVATGEDRRTV